MTDRDQSITVKALLMGLFSVSIGFTDASLANTRDQAYTLHNRLTGTPPTEPILEQMSTLIEQNNKIDSALLAMEHPAFCNVVLKNHAAKLTNQEGSSFVPLNDGAATIIGMIRDDVPFNTVLTADLVYIGSSAATDIAYTQTDNAHYLDLESNTIDLCDPAMLVPTAQSELPGSQLMPVDTAGFVTTRAAAEAYFSAGTNRAMLRYTLMNFLCHDLEDLHDISVAPDFIRQDVTRQPGGDSAVFLNQCIGCHAGMDALAGAFAYYEWDDELERMTFTSGRVQGKYLINASVFPEGYVTTDDRWINYWREGKNSVLGWSAASLGQGNGAKSLSLELSSSRAFSACQVEKVFEEVCFRKPTSAADQMEAARIADVFEQSNYSMKQVFAETSVYCLAE